MTSLKRFILVFIFIAGCRTVSPVDKLQASTEPNISRVMMKDGKVVEFNRDFGWYDEQAKIIEGVTSDSQHVEYHLSELSRVETVRAYEIIPAILTGGILLGTGIYLLAKLLTFLQVL